MDKSILFNSVALISELEALIAWLHLNSPDKILLEIKDPQKPLDEAYITVTAPICRNKGESAKVTFYQHLESI